MRSTLSFRCLRLDRGVETGTPTITESDLIHAEEYEFSDAGVSDEVRKFRDTVRVLAAEKETISLNIYNVSTEWGRFPDDNQTLIFWVDDLTERVTSFPN